MDMTKVHKPSTTARYGKRLTTVSMYPRGKEFSIKGIKKGAIKGKKFLRIF